MAGFVRIRQVESRLNLGFGRTLRLSSDRHDLIPPPLACINENYMIPSFLYHYTAVETLIQILKNQTIRFKRIDLMNAPHEGHLSSFVDSKKYGFSSSWTAQALDEIPMWKMYNDLKGIRIRMPVDMFNHKDKMTIAKIKKNNNFLIKSELNKSYPVYYQPPITNPKGETLDFNINCVYGPTQIEYMDNFESISDNIVSKKEDISDFNFYEINLNMIGQRKINFWSFEKEYRFRVFLNDSIMLAGSDVVLKDTFKNHDISNEFIDINVTKEAFNGLEILLGPKTRNKDKIKIEKVLKESNISNYNIIKSKIEINQ